MWKQKMCMNISPAFGLGAVEQIKLLKKIGFDGFFRNIQMTRTLQNKNVLRMKSE